MVSKQLLRKAIAGLTGIAILGLSGLSFAGGEYAPAPAPTSGPVSEEGKAGFYAGVRAGYVNTHDFKGIKKADVLGGWLVSKRKQDGFTGGVNVGYAFSKFFGVEAGYLALPTAKVSVDRKIAGFLVNHDLSIKRHAFDISAKGTFPIPSMENFGAYVKAGAGFVNTKASLDSAENFVWNTNSLKLSTSQKESQKHTKATLTYGVGVYWDVTPSIRVDAGWQRFNRRSGLIPNIDTATVGVSYFFGGDELFNS